MQEEYYLNNLYTLQNRIFSILEKLNTGFYLTGGTALSRFYLHHRFSDDLDFFVNAHPDFKKISETVEKALSAEFKQQLELGVVAETFIRIIIHQQQCDLKIDLVNDIPIYFGKPEKFELFSSVDNPLNILSNKISALARSNPKDVSDILCLSEKYPFNWSEIIENAKQKDMWVNPLDVSSMLDSFPVKLFEEIIWVKKPDFQTAAEKIKIIARDIVKGDDNSLFSH